MRIFKTIHFIAISFISLSFTVLHAQQFNFNDGTIQGWTIDQLYNTSTGAKIVPATSFLLQNVTNELHSSINCWLIGDASVTQCEFYLESPDLSANSAWQNIEGYSVDITRKLWSPCYGDFPKWFYVQLQMRVIDKSDGNKEKLYAEYNGTNFIFHDILTMGKLYQFSWKPSFLNSNFTVKSLRIKVIGPGDMSPECCMKGSWVVDNIYALGGSSTAASITVANPNGNETWQAGQPKVISWIGQKIEGKNVKIEYSTDNGTIYDFIAEETSDGNSGSYIWDVPNTPSDQCLVRLSVESEEISDVSDGPFEIYADESITLDSPAGNENWTSGTQHNLVWHTDFFTGAVKIEYSIDGGSTYATIENSYSGGNSYQWTLPVIASDSCRIRISDAADGTPSDYNKIFFIISGGTTVNTPQGDTVVVDLGGGIISFNHITAAGSTSLDINTTGPPPAAGSIIIPPSSPMYYNVNTTAAYYGEITLEFHYIDAGMTPDQENHLKLCRFSEIGSKWESLVTCVDIENNIVRGKTGHLSAFAVIIDTTSITLFSPNGSEKLAAGSEQIISWTSTGIIDSIRIRYLNVYTGSYSPVAESIPNTGSYIWHVPNAVSSDCSILIEDAADGFPWDNSDAVFSITSGTSGAFAVTNTADAGPGSLREAITNANLKPGLDTIVFNLNDTIPGYIPDQGVWFFDLQNQLPVITDPLMIDGFSQRIFAGDDRNPYGPEIFISGSSILASGLWIESFNVHVYGLIISGFSGAGIVIKNSPGCGVHGCYIGVNSSGDQAIPNNYGIEVLNCSDFLLTPADTNRNIITGNTYVGLHLMDTTRNAVVADNIFGLYRSLTDGAGNGNYGGVEVDKCHNVHITNNRIGKNTMGVFIISSDSVKIENNFIGTVPDQDGLDLGNEQAGVYFSEAYDNLVTGNMIQYNNVGVYVYDSTSVRNKITHNCITKNVSYGIVLDGGNLEIEPPVLTNVSASLIEGTALPNSFVEIYTDQELQGDFYLGKSDVDGSGHFQFSVPAVELLNNITALTIDDQGNTSCFSYPAAVGIFEREKEAIPDHFELMQNFPNPFNPVTKIVYAVPEKSFVSIKLYDILGAEIVTLINEDKEPGYYEFNLDASSAAGGLSSGIYFYKIKAGDFLSTKKMILLK